MDDYEIRGLIDDVKKEIDDVRYDLRRAVEDIENRLNRKADKAHTHDE